jgi:hypothetical protein
MGTRECGESIANSPRVSAAPSPFLTPALITEATEWQVNPAGEIILVANPSSPLGQNSLSYLTVCPES